MVFFGFCTVHQGERVQVRNHKGEAKVVDGPRRLLLYRSDTLKLHQYRAGQHEYLDVQGTDGERKVFPGPCSMYEDPLLYTSVRVMTAEFVNANEAMVIYRVKAGKANSGSPVLTKEGNPNFKAQENVERVVLRGPARYVPQPNEWLHQFIWHGTDKASSDRAKKVVGALNFTKLRVIADQTYYNVTDVRTKDDTLLIIKLMIFFELIDIEKMLDNTHDPIADFINAAASDVVAYCATQKYEEFLERTNALNQKETFSQLLSRAENIGYRINKVVFRGFHSSDALQAMQDKAIQERTRLRLEAFTEEQRQKRLDMQLNKEEERADRHRQLEIAKMSLKRDMAREDHQQAMEQAREQQVLEGEAEDRMLRNEVGKLKIEIQRLEKMRELGVDLTKVMVAEQRAPDRHLRIDGSQQVAKVHLHENISGVGVAEEREGTQQGEQGEQ